jgi:MFS family permease
VDRRLVIGGLATLGAGVCILGAWFAGSATVLLYAAICLLCATTMPVYALCVALAADETELTLVEVTSGLLLAHGIGSVIGPMIAAPMISSLGPNAYFVFCAICLGGAAIWTLHRYMVFRRPSTHEVHAPMLPRTTQAVAEMFDEQETAPPKNSA